LPVLIMSNRLYSYWTLHFDASPRTLRSLNGIMRRDPRVLRWTVLKLADNLEELAKQGQKMQTTANIHSPVNTIVD
jgi:small subunit ribosomal protein S6